VPTNRSDDYAAFDVVVVPFPYADRLIEKRRPAIVVSIPELASEYGLAWLAMVTSADNRRWECDIVVADLKAAGLPAPSLVRPAKIATVDVARIVRRIGALGERDRNGLAERMRSFLG